MNFLTTFNLKGKFHFCSYFFQVNFSCPVFNTDIIDLSDFPDMLLSAAISIIVPICDNVKQLVWGYTFPAESCKASLGYFSVLPTVT